LRRITCILAFCALALAVGGPAVAATCTQAEKDAAVAALAAYQKKIPKERAAYFKRHKKAKQRKAFVKKQQSKLKRLREAAGCDVPPPPDTRPPALTAAAVNGATVTLTFDEDLSGSAAASAFGVTVDRLHWRVENAAVSGHDVVLTLGLAVNAGEVVEVTYTPAGLADSTGNAVTAFTANPVNGTSAVAPPFQPGYTLSLLKPGFADNRDVPERQTWVGEWGPKTDAWWLRSTGTVRGLIIPVDFADSPATKTVEFYRDYLIPPSERYYAEDSYGRMNLDLDILASWNRVTKPASHYASVWSTREGRLEFLRDASALVDPQVNFASYDALYFIAPDALAGTLSLRLERPWPDEAVVRDGKPILFTVMGGAGLDPRGPSSNLAAHHIVTHETGHFLGLPDLYDQAHRGTPEQFSWAGRWDIMSDNRASSHMFAWHKWLLGWLDPTQLRGLTSAGSTEVELTPLERKGGLKAVVVPISPSVAYVIEDRQRIGEDIELCDDGVLVWIVDSSKANVDGNAIVQAAGHSYSDACGAIYDAGYDLGPGEVSSFEDARVRMEVLEAKPNGNYRVRVTRK
jgi:M6 family metalloprotease-like protein